MTRTPMPVQDEVWVALEGELNPLEARRRIRGKTTVRACLVDGDDAEELQGRDQQKR